MLDALFDLLWVVQASVAESVLSVSNLEEGVVTSGSFESALSPSSWAHWLWHSGHLHVVGGVHAHHGWSLVL